MRNTAKWYTIIRRLVFVAVLGCGFMFQSAFQSAIAGGSWFSKARQKTQMSEDFPATRAAGDIGTTVFDVVRQLDKNNHPIIDVYGSCTYRIDIDEVLPEFWVT